MSFHHEENSSAPHTAHFVTSASKGWREREYIKAQFQEARLISEISTSLMMESRLPFCKGKIGPHPDAFEEFNEKLKI